MRRLSWYVGFLFVLGLCSGGAFDPGGAASGAPATPSSTGGTGILPVPSTGSGQTPAPPVAQKGFGADSNPSAYRRWAIVATKAMEGTGLPDLLEVKLAAEPGLELVERQKFPTITGELELSACFGSEAAAKRLKLGQLLGADALVLLSLEEWQGPPLADGKATPPGGAQRKKFVKLVISECRYGARLHVEYLPFAADAPGAIRGMVALRDECAGLVDQSRRRFAGGIRQLIGVTHFLSKNLTHDYDHLQAGYAYLLEAALTNYPGVAVIETEEARAIRRELDIAGGGLKDRVAPVFVEGEYEMSPAKPGTEPTMRLLIRVTDGKQVSTEIRKDAVAMSETPETIRGPVARQIAILAQEVGESGLSRTQQHAMLTIRAGTFSQFGAYEHSTGLREAALLLHPDDADQRLRLIADYFCWHHSENRRPLDRPQQAIATSRPQPGQAIPSDAREPAYDAQLSLLRLLILHAEEAIRRRELNPREADLLIAAVHGEIFWPRLGPYNVPAQRKFRAERLAMADELFWRAYPLFPSLDPAMRQGRVSPVLAAALGSQGGSLPHSAIRQYVDWTRTAGVYLMRARGPWALAEREGLTTVRVKALDDLVRFLTEVASPTVPIPWMLETMTQTNLMEGLNRQITDGRFKPEEVSAFYERLIKTGKPLNRFYGRLGLLSLSTYMQKSERLDPEALQELDAFSKLVREQDPGDPDYALVVRSCESAIARLRAVASQRVRAKPTTKGYVLPDNPIPPSTPPSHPDAKVAFEAVEAIKPDWIGLRRCNDDLDIAWSYNTVYAIRREGPPERIFYPAVPPREITVDRIFLPCWDGRNIWIPHMTNGIWVVSPAGRVLGRVTADQLPPYAPRGEGENSGTTARQPGSSVFFGMRPDRTSVSAPQPDFAFSGRQSLALHPVAPGKCIAIGSFGQRGPGASTGTNRIWFALVSGNEDGGGGLSFDVKVFHTAVKIPSRDERADDDDPTETFDPGWMSECRLPGAHGRRLLLVGRGARPVAAGPRQVFAFTPPLAIDLETLAVSVLPVRLTRSLSCRWLRYYFIDNSIVVASDCGIDLLVPPENGVGPWKLRPLLDCEASKQPVLWPPQLIVHGGAVYNPGGLWRRIDPKTWQVEQLNENPLPWRYHYEYYSASARYGLVAWNRSDFLYRAVVGPRTSDPDLATLYPHVPAAERAAHHGAIEAIQRLGGSVDEHYGNDDWPRQWQTTVQVSGNWKGGDSGLSHLERLHNLRILMLSRAPITDEAMRTVGRIKTLRQLYLTGTRATDAGLPHVQGLDNLTHLRLEGTTGGSEFTDAGLKYISSLPRLTTLTLCGPGFTDQGLEEIQKLPVLQLLLLRSTKMTPTAVTKLKPPRKGSSFSVRLE